MPGRGRRSAWPPGMTLGATPAATATLAGLTACWATWPDMDQIGSCAARSLGFASKLVAYLIRWVSRGHRHGTHTFIGAAVITAITAAACYGRGILPVRWFLDGILALALAAGANALHIHRLKVGRRHLGDDATEGLAIFLAGLMAWRGYTLTLVPVSCALGNAVHILGDGCTDEGVPALSPFLHGHQHFLPEPFSFTTDTKPETLIVAPGLMVLTAALAAHAAGVPIPHLAHLAGLLH